jgi:hypothetical protein
VASRVVSHEALSRVQRGFVEPVLRLSILGPLEVFENGRRLSLRGRNPRMQVVVGEIDDDAHLAARCRKHSGTAAMASGRVPREGFRLVSGKQLLRVYRPEGGMAKVFRTNCGSSLFGGSWPDGPEVSVRLGSLDADPGIAPHYHSHVDSKAPWDSLPDDGLPRYGGAPPRAVVEP